MPLPLCLHVSIDSIVRVVSGGAPAGAGGGRGAGAAGARAGRAAAGARARGLAPRLPLREGPGLTRAPRGRRLHRYMYILCSTSFKLLIIKHVT